MWNHSPIVTVKYEIHQSDAAVSVRYGIDQSYLNLAVKKMVVTCIDSWHPKRCSFNYCPINIL